MKRPPAWVWVVGVVVLGVVVLAYRGGDAGTVNTAPVAESTVERAAALAMLNEFTDFYNADDFIHATRYYSSALESACGGPTALAFALSQLKRSEEILYFPINVVPGGGADMADFTYAEEWNGSRETYAVGLAFVLEDGSWKMADLWPLGVSAFCQ